MRNIIILLCGKSGSGKSTVAAAMHKMFGWQGINSYTTRPKRTPDETGHIFVSESEFDGIPMTDMVAYTRYNGYRYCVTRQQVNNADLYVIDKAGIDAFRKNYHGEKHFLVVYLNAPESLLKARMRGRGDSEETIRNKLALDRTAFEGIEDVCDIALNAKASPEQIAYQLYELVEIASSHLNDVDPEELRKFRHHVYRQIKLGDILADLQASKKADLPVYQSMFEFASRIFGISIREWNFLADA